MHNTFQLAWNDKLQAGRDATVGDRLAMAVRWAMVDGTSRAKAAGCALSVAHSQHLLLQDLGSKLEVTARWLLTALQI